MKLSRPIPQWFRRLLDSPGGELTRWERTARYSIDLAWHCTKALQHDRAGEMAAALTYRTIFSLIPIVVLSLVAFGQFADFKELRGSAQDKALHYLGLDLLSYNAPVQAQADVPATEGPAPPEGDFDSPAASPAQSEKQAQANLVVENINAAIEKIQGLNFKSIGIVGVALLIWGAIGLVVALEDSFNQVFGAPVGRSWGRRIIVYWAALTLGPVLLVLSTYLASRFGSLIDAWNEGLNWAWVTAVVGFFKRFTAVFLSWALLVFLYRMMPNTRVNLRPAAIGALVAAILWEFGKYGFGLYVRTALPYSALYGTLGLIPLFLFWVYITWLTILFGLELTYTLQNMRGRRFKHEEHKQVEQVVDPSWAVPLASKIARAFRSGQTCRTDELGLEMNLPPRVITRMLAALEEAGLVHRVVKGEEDKGVTLSRPAEQIVIADVVRAGQSLFPESAATRNGDPAWKFLDTVKGTHRDLLEKTTLADLAAEPSNPAQPAA